MIFPSHWIHLRLKGCAAFHVTNNYWLLCRKRGRLRITNMPHRVKLQIRELGQVKKTLYLPARLIYVELSDLLFLL